jgi:WD repeat-containing protein 19
MLRDMHAALLARGLGVPSELAAALCVVHSYVIVRPLIKAGDHPAAARMLIRVAKNISKFPLRRGHPPPPDPRRCCADFDVNGHRVSARGVKALGVRVCNDAHAAFPPPPPVDGCRPEYKDEIQAAYKRKIESSVRKPDKSEEIEPLSPCPFCKNMMYF